MNETRELEQAVLMASRKSKSPVRFAKAMKAKTPAIMPAEVVTDALSEDVNFSLQAQHRPGPGRRWSALNEF